MTHHGVHLHPLCAEIIVKVTDCYKQRYIAKFWGVCEDLRQEMDACLFKEVFFVEFVDDVV